MKRRHASPQQHIFDDWKRRLVAMADRPPYVYKETSEHLIERHYDRLTRFEGYPEADVAAAEQKLGLEFPGYFRSFLLEMGKAHGELFCGSDFAGLSKLGAFRRDATELIAATDPTLALPSNAVVFLFHQGYVFDFLVCESTAAVVMEWSEGDLEPTEISSTFEDFVEQRLRGMEAGHRGLVERGGYYLTLYEEGGKQEYPALHRGDRPLDRFEAGSSISPRDTRPGLASRLSGLWRRWTTAADS